MRNFIWQEKPWQAFKNFAIAFSFIFNGLLLIVILLLAPLLFPGLDIIAHPLVGGLSESFVEMKNATIEHSIAVEDQIPVVFTLPVSTETTVVLVEPVPLNLPATFNLPGGGGAIRGNVSIQLPDGLQLPVQLDVAVPVSQTVPVDLAVDVSIPLAETELGPPFATLEGLFLPLDQMLDRLPDSNADLRSRVSAGPPAPTTNAQTHGPASRPQ